MINPTQGALPGLVLWKRPTKRGGCLKGGRLFGLNPIEYSSCFRRDSVAGLSGNIQSMGVLSVIGEFSEPVIEIETMKINLNSNPMKSVICSLGVCCVMAAEGGEVTFSSETPVVNAADIANLTWTDTRTEKVYSDASNPGQTFTTGDDPDGYALNSFSIQINSTSKTDPEPAGRFYNIRVIRIDEGGATTTVALETDHVQNGPWSEGDWMTWTLDVPVNLLPDTQYGIDIEHVSGGGWPNGIPYLRYNQSDDYAEGSGYNRADGDPAEINDDARRDFVFHLDIGTGSGPVDVPEIISFVSVGDGVWELVIEGRADTGYRFVSSSTLEFGAGTEINSLSQGDEENDAGTVADGSLLTTNEDGLGKVQLTLAGDLSDFVRVEAP